MPSSTVCTGKVEDAVKAVLEAIAGASEPLDGWTILTEQSKDEAVDTDKVAVIYTSACEMAQSDEQGQTLWTQTLDIEFIDGPQTSGSITRAAITAMAHVHAALAADRSLGGMLQDMQEQDIAGTQAEGKDVAGSSLRYQVQFFTARDNWFVILGAAGAQF